MIGDILQPTHLLFVLVVALLVLGPKRLPEVGRSLGRGLRDFRAALSGEEDDHHDELAGGPASEPGHVAEPSQPSVSASEPTQTAEPAHVAAAEPPHATEPLHVGAPDAPADPTQADEPARPPAPEPAEHVN